jgi:hypothetical protein
MPDEPEVTLHSMGPMIPRPPSMEAVEIPRMPTPIEESDGTNNFTDKFNAGAKVE